MELADDDQVDLVERSSLSSYYYTLLLSKKERVCTLLNYIHLTKHCGMKTIQLKLKNKWNTNISHTINYNLEWNVKKIITTKIRFSTSEWHMSWKTIKGKQLHLEAGHNKTVTVHIFIYEHTYLRVNRQCIFMCCHLKWECHTGNLLGATVLKTQVCTDRKN